MFKHEVSGEGLFRVLTPEGIIANLIGGFELASAGMRRIYYK